MPSPPLLDPDLLRSLVLVAEERSFTRAAERVGRTQSAVSLQIQRLETAVGHLLLSRSKGGAVELTDEGRLLVAHAHRILSLNADLFAALKSPALPKVVRFGAVDYQAQGYLAEVLKGFTAAYPGVQVEMEHTLSCRLATKLRAGELDLMVGSKGHEPPGWPSVTLKSTRLRWIVAEGSSAHLQDPLPISINPEECQWRPPWLPDCPWRAATLSALGRSGRSYRIISTATTLSGQRA
jgi:DNA-binding transcriptional LysR family regulator